MVANVRTASVTTRPISQRTDLADVVWQSLTSCEGGTSRKAVGVVLYISRTSRHCPEREWPWGAPLDVAVCAMLALPPCGL